MIDKIFQLLADMGVGLLFWLDKTWAAHRPRGVDAQLPH